MCEAVLAFRGLGGDQNSRILSYDVQQNLMKSGLFSTMWLYSVHVINQHIKVCRTPWYAVHCVF